LILLQNGCNIYKLKGVNSNKKEAATPNMRQEEIKSEGRRNGCTELLQLSEKLSRRKPFTPKGYYPQM